MDKDKKEQAARKNGKDREELADKVLDIFSDRPEELNSLVELLKGLEDNPVLHPEKSMEQIGKKTDKVEEKGKGEEKEDSKPAE